MNIIKKIMDSDTLLDVLIQVEDFMDNLDIYAFRNWEDGIIVDGPDITRYWVTISLLYDYESMPDPYGGLRLINSGSKVEYKIIKVENNDFSTSDKMNIDSLNSTGANPSLYGSSLVNQNAEVGKKYNDKWLVTITIPRQFIDDLNDINLDSFDSDVQNSLEQEYRIKGENIDEVE